MGIYTITPMNLGRVTREKSFFTYMTDPGKKQELAVPSFLIRGGGYNILVDTGGPLPEATAPWHLPYEVNADETMPAQLARYGVKPEDIDLIIFTHLHWDHCYNVELFPRAHFFVTRRELEYAKDPLPRQEWMYDSPRSGVRPPYLDIDFHFTEDEQEIVPGIRVFLTPGHAPGHQSVAVETVAGRYILAGDIAPLYENWEKRIPSGMLMNLEECYKSFQRIEKMGGTVIPAHDPQLFSRAVVGGRPGER